MSSAETSLQLITALKNAIEASGLTLRAMGEKSGVHHSQIGKFLNGRSIHLASAARLCSALGMVLVHESELRPSEPEPAPAVTRRTRKPR